MTIADKGKLAIALFLLVGLLSAATYISKLRETIYRTELAKDSIEAVNSQTVKVGDTWMRRAIQTELVADSLNKALKTKPKVIVKTEFVVTPVDGTVVAPIAVSDSLFEMKFHEVKPPYTVDAAVIGNTLSKVGSLTYSVKLDPFKIGVRVDCGVETNGIRPATVGFETPTFIAVSLDTVRQSKEVCSLRPVLAPQNKSKLKATFWFVVGAASAIAGVRAVSR